MNRRDFLRVGSLAATTSPLALIQLSSRQSDVFRLSTEKGDPGFIPFGKLMADSRCPTVFLDGVKQDWCLTADAREGWIKRHVVTDAGNLACVNDEFCTEIVHGKVVIEIPDAPDRSAA